MSDKNRLVFSCVNAETFDDYGAEIEELIPYVEESQRQELQDELDINAIFLNLSDYIKEKCILIGYANKKLQTSDGDSFDFIPDNHSLCVYQNVERGYYWYRFEALENYKLDEDYENMHIIIYNVENNYVGDNVEEYKSALYEVITNSKNNVRMAIETYLVPADLEKDGVL